MFLVGRIAGAIILGLVIATYAFALRTGVRPPSHPWSGITLVILSGMLWFGGRAGGVYPLWFAAVGLPSALFWVRAAALK